MRIHLSRFLGWLGVFVAVGVAAHAEFSAGFAAVDITPPIGWRRAGGYSEVLGTGVKDPLQAKAVVVAQGGTAVAFVGNDLCSVPRELTDRARAAASKKTGIPVANIVITATHTHGGPEFLDRCARRCTREPQRRTAGSIRASLRTIRRGWSRAGPRRSCGRMQRASP